MASLASHVDGREALRARKAILVVGAAGIGKTTYARSMVERLDHVVGQSLASFSEVPYRPLAHALRRDVWGAPPDVASDVVGALEGRVLWLEDLHWADSATLEVLDRLVGRVPLLLTSRRDPGIGGSDHVATVEVPPLGARAAASLVRTVHPALDRAAQARLLAAAGGNPLLLRTLARGTEVTVSLAEAISSRVARLPPREFDALGILALHGEPAPPSLLGLDTPEQLEGLLVADGGLLWFAHPLYAQAVHDLLTPDQQVQLRRLLIDRCDDAGAARHLFVLGEVREGARRALLGAAAAPFSQRADLLAATVRGLGGDCPARVRLDAAEAMVTAHRTAVVRELLGARDGLTPLERAEALLYLGRAAWLDADGPTALAKFDEADELLGAVESPLLAQLAVERATVLVRSRVGDPSLASLAQQAVDVAERVGIARARAHNVAGQALSHSGQPGWFQHFTRAAEIARDEGDIEEECAATYWMTSALGFYGPMGAAIEMSAPMLERSRALGLRRWVLHFRGARPVWLLATGQLHDHDVADAEQLLVEEPQFRNRAQVEMVLVAAHVDRLQFDAATAVVRAGRVAARTKEDLALIACGAVDLAAALGDPALVRAEVEALVALSAGFFGVNAVAESAAIHGLVHSADDGWDLPAFSNMLTPVLDVVRIERRGFDAWRSGDQAGAIAHFTAAGAEWHQRGLHRFAHRARMTAIESAIRAGDFERATALLELARSAPRPVGAGADVRLAASGRRLVSARAAHLLSRREAEVVRLVGQGLSTGAIAAELGVAPATVNSQINSALRKLGCRTRRQAAAMLAGRVP